MSYSMSLVGDDARALEIVVNMGIDARLEAFTDSSFNSNGHRIDAKIDDSEMQIFLRRMIELEESTEDIDLCDAANNLVEIIVGQLWGIGEYGYLAREE
jgi:hypothetical protein